MKKNHKQFKNIEYHKLSKKELSVIKGGTDDDDPKKDPPVPPPPPPPGP